MSEPAAAAAPGWDVTWPPDWDGALAGETPFGPETLDTALRELLAQSPEAAVMAIADSGLLQDMPAGVPLGALQRVVKGAATALDLVDDADTRTVIETWERTRRVGAARALVRPVGDPEHPVGIYFVDQRHRFGCYLGVLQVASDVQRRPGAEEVLRPRVATLRKDQFAVIVAVDDALPQMLGWPESELVGLRSLELVDPRDHSAAVASWVSMLSEPGARRRVRLRHRRKDGTWIWLEVTNHNLLDDASVGEVLTEMVDVTDEMAAQDALRHREELLRRLNETLPFGVLHFDQQGASIYHNERLRRFIPSLRGVDELVERVVEADQPGLRAALQSALDGVDADLEVRILEPGCAVRFAAVAVRPLAAGEEGGAGGLVCLTDITDAVGLRERLERRATYDSLTDCFNRSAILSLLADALRRSGPGDGVCVVFVDLDDLKTINDVHGHRVGDEMLAELAGRLGRRCRGGDVVGRLGGDEFVVVCSQVGSPAQARQIAGRLSRGLDGEVRTSALRLPVRASFGFAWTDDPATSPDALVTSADQDMYREKRRRRSPVE